MCTSHTQKSLIRGTDWKKEVFFAVSLLIFMYDKWPRLNFWNKHAWKNIPERYFVDVWQFYHLRSNQKQNCSQQGPLTLTTRKNIALHHYFLCDGDIFCSFKGIVWDKFNTLSLKECVKYSYFYLLYSN